MVEEGSEPRRNRIPGRLAWILSSASVLLVIAAFGLALRAAISSGDYQAILSHQSLTPFATAIYAVIGALVASRKPRNPIGWIFVVVSCLHALNALMAALVHQEGLPFLVRQAAGWLDNWIWIH